MDDRWIEDNAAEVLATTMARPTDTVSPSESGRTLRGL